MDLAIPESWKCGESSLSDDVVGNESWGNFF